MLSPYRRHLFDCPHLPKGQVFTLCDCPIWCYGKLNGKPLRRSLQTADWQRAAQRIELLERGGDQFFDREQSTTINDAVTRFLASCRRRSLQESTLRSYTKTLEHLTDSLGSRAVRAVGLEALDDYGQGRKVQPRTWRKELETLRAFFAWCIERKLTTENPAKKLKMPRIDTIATLPFTDDEVSALIAACDIIATDDPGELAYVRHRARALVYTLVYSGLRVSDVAKLRRSALDVTTGHLSLKTQKTGVMLKVLLHPEAKRVLETLPARHPDYFFWTGNGDIITCIKNMRKTMNRLGAIAKVHAHPHRFRDTFAVTLLTNGADIRTVQKMLGHESVETTEKHYAHFIAAHQALLDAAASTLDFGKNARPVLVKPLKNRRRNA